MIGALEPRSHDRLPTSAVIEGADAEKPRNSKRVDGERRCVSWSSNEHERDTETEGGHERPEMKQPSQEWPRQTFREQVPIGRRAEALRTSQARTPARTGAA